MKFSSNKKAFTLIEIVIIIFLISVGLTWILYSLNRGLWFVQQSRETVLAINMAREGMEQVFNIRDTNWRRWEWVKESCWLKVDPLDSSESNSDTCVDDEWMQSWSYVLLSKDVFGQKYFAMSGENTALDLWDGIDLSDLQYSLCEISGSWKSCPWQPPLSKEWKYFREVVWKWLYRKDVSESGGKYISCENWEDTDDDSNDCGDVRAKEFRFCVRVAYIWKRTSSVELCSMMTNFY